MSDFTAGPVYMGDGSKGRHEWIIEFSKALGNEAKFFDILDATLRQVNSDYDAKRFQNIALLEPLVHVVPSGTFYAWMGGRKKFGGQNKVPRLSNDRIYLEGILAVIGHEN